MKKEETITVLFKKNTISKFEIMEIKNELSVLQELVGGYIEFVGLPNGIDLIVNDEGMINGMPYNCTFGTHHLFGPIIMAKSDENGELISLDEMTKDYMINFINTLI